MQEQIDVCNAIINFRVHALQKNGAILAFAKLLE